MSGARAVLEIGTLGGYSTLWLLAGLRDDGTVVTVEHDAAHAAFAKDQFERAGVDERIEIRHGDGHAVIEQLRSERGEASFDVAFVDADKTGYPDYWRSLRSMVRVGGLIVIDNALGTGSMWIDEMTTTGIEAIDQMNRLAASDPDFVVACVPMREGILIGRRQR